ncbi:CBS domain-containing protein [Kitasatospora purpeofusca]|uniref:CBS domain-containing protein n=1 Tax=Kitasatospora purpeofusca TaxID=67352 RepID=UPI003F4ABA84
MNTVTTYSPHTDVTTYSPQTERPGHGLTVADAMEPCEYQIADDSTVDQADDILHGADIEYLLVRDHDGRCEGLVTRTGLHPFLERARSTERTAISATTHQRGPFAWPTMGLALAAIAMRIKHLAVWPVVDEDGYILGVLTADRASGLLVTGLLATTAPTP